MLTAGDKCVLAFEDLSFEVDAESGARVISVRVGGRELLSSKSIHPQNFGSTFWTSPQSDWSWPPVPALDSEPFTVVDVGAGSCTLVSRVVSAPEHPNVDGIRVQKTFEVDVERRAIRAEYRIENHGGTVKRLAPWEITRVPPHGLTFYAADCPPSPGGPFVITPTQAGAGARWFEHTSGLGKTKLISDGQGWIAHLAGDVLLVKAFADVHADDAAPGEGEIEIYSEDSYVEVENQGAYVEIPPGAHHDWTVRWYARRLPATVAGVALNPDLVSFVAETIR